MNTEPITKLEFVGFNKIPRLSRDVVITEKIDGSNGIIYITENNEFYVGSRNRWITPENDNYGFARWAYEHKEQLLTLGVGRHFGEWWGNGIQRGYDLKEKRFSLFNVGRFCLFNQEPQKIGVDKYQQKLPECCNLVPVLYRGVFDTNKINEVLQELKDKGSVASPGFMRPEGIIIYHIAGNLYFKKTIEKDESHKSIE